MGFLLYKSIFLLYKLPNKYNRKLFFHNIKLDFWKKIMKEKNRFSPYESKKKYFVESEKQTIRNLIYTILYYIKLVGGIVIHVWGDAT